MRTTIVRKAPPVWLRGFKDPKPGGASDPILLLQALTTDVDRSHGRRFDRFYGRNGNVLKLTVDISVVIFDPCLSVPDDTRSWIVPGTFCCSPNAAG